MSVTDRKSEISTSPSAKPAKLAFAVAFSALLLGGCNTSGTTSQTEKNFTERLLFANTKLPEQKAEEARDLGCPATSILDGTAAYRVGNSGQARGISHQAAIHDLARECTTTGNTMRIKVGIQGRLILGDGGKPGTYSVPVRVAVRANGQTIQSRLVPTSVTIPADDTQSAFVVIDDSISVPVTAEDPADVYSILVGLDPQGGRQAPKRRR